MNQRMHRQSEFSKSPDGRRRGAAQVMIALMLFIFAIMSAFMIDFAYMQLIRGQARMVADSAARAGAEALVRTRDPNLAIQAAVDIAGLNEVGGRTFVLSSSDVVLGQSIAASNGGWTFNEGATPYNSVRVTSRVRHDSPFGAAPLFFGGVTGIDDFQTRAQATAGEQPVEICLCLDRSLSMSQEAIVTFRWPAGNPLLYPLSYYRSSLPLCYQHSPPHPTISRWATLRAALDVFFTECAKAVNPPRVALVTFSTETTQKLYPFLEYSTSSVDVSMPTGAGITWASNLSLLQTSLANRSSQPMAGNTNTNAGLQRAVDVCTGATGRVQARKVIILMTDGANDPGASPVPAANNAAAAGITVHCVSMLLARQSVLDQVASLTGGKYYVTGVTSNSAQQSFTELQAAFRDIANQIPIVLME